MPNKRRAIPPTLPLAVQDLLALQAAAKMTDAIMTKRAGYAQALPSQWRRGTHPSLPALIVFAEVFDYEVRLVPKEKP